MAKRNEEFFICRSIIINLVPSKDSFNKRSYSLIKPFNEILEAWQNRLLTLLYHSHFGKLHNQRFFAGFFKVNFGFFIGASAIQIQYLPIPKTDMLYFIAYLHATYVSLFKVGVNGVRCRFMAVVL